VKATYAAQLVLGLALTSAALSTVVLAGNQNQSLFLGSLFPPGFTATANRATLVKQRAAGTMKNPPDNSSIRVSAAQAKRLMQSQPATLVQLGTNLFFDTSFSNPAGQSCSSCHSPGAGFSAPNSLVNAQMGPVAGAVRGRFRNRIPPSVAYTVFSPPGPVYHPELGAYAGGLFWDGRTANLQTQVPFPLENPNEMNNILHNVVDPAHVISAIQNGPNATMYKAIFGQDVFTKSTAQNMTYVAQAIAAYESSSLVSPFSSKYDSYLAGRASLTAI
jgi:cytochrome c peroxidase